MTILRGCVLALALQVGISGAFGQLVAYYSFNDGTANDASGNGFNATYNGAVVTSSGYAGGAFAFNGTSTSYIQIDSLNINSNVYATLTMGAWVYATDVSSAIRQVISHDNGGFDRSLGLDNRGSVVGWSTFVGSGVLGGQTATAATWTFIAVAYNQTAGTAMLYVNGTTFTSNSAYDSGGWNYTRIGSNPSFPAEMFIGSVDEVFFFSSALTASQLDNIRLNGVMAAVPEPTTTALLIGLATAGVVTSLQRKSRRFAR